MTTPDRTEVLIVGAGPTGLTLAIELARRGITTRVIDKMDGPAPHSRAIAIQARTLELFAAMGVVDDVCAAGVRIRGANFHLSDRQRVSLAIIGIESPYPYVIALPQNETERILRARLEALGGRIEWGVGLTALTQDGAGVTSMLAHANGTEEHVRSSYVVGCDGAHSAVRHLAHFPFAGGAYDETFRIADVHVDWQGSADEMFLSLRDGHFFLVVPLDKSGRYRLFDRVPPTEATHEPTLADFQAVMDQLGPKGARLSDPTWFSAFHLHHRKVAQYSHERLFVAGDAAHIHSPAGGQGMNTGIQDAVNLAWKLAFTLRGTAKDTLLATYDTERNAVGKQVVRTTDTVFRLANSRNPFIQTLRNLVITLVVPRQAIRRAFWRTISETGIHYAPNMAVARDPGGAGVRTGSRAPDAVLVNTTDGRHTRLFPVLAAAPERYTLLLLSSAATTHAEHAALRALADTVAARYAAVVAPVWIGAGQDIAALEAEAGSDSCFRDPTGAMTAQYGAGHDRVSRAA